MRNDDFSVSDFIMGEFLKRFCGQRGQVHEEAPALRAVTADNAHEFSQAPKRRGRKPKVQIGGNVVAFQRPARTDWPPGWSERLESAYMRLRRACDDGALPPANRADRERLRSMLEHIAPRADEQRAAEADADFRAQFRRCMHRVDAILACYGTNTRGSDASTDGPGPKGEK